MPTILQRYLIDVNNIFDSSVLCGQDSSRIVFGLHERTSFLTVCTAPVPQLQRKSIEPVSTYNRRLHTDQAISSPLERLFNTGPLGAAIARGENWISSTWMTSVSRRLSELWRENFVPLPLFFWETHMEAQVDLFWIEGGKVWAVECKYFDAPRLTRSTMVSACADLALEHLWVIYPGKKRYRLSEHVSALPSTEVEYRWNSST